MQGGENIGNSSILEVPITQFSDSIQENLRKPISDFEDSNLETDNLWHALRNNGYTKKDDIYVIQSDEYPIFRKWDKDNNNCIFTRRIKNSNLAISPKPEVFLVIDYGLIEQNFNSLEHAQKVIEYWAEQTTNKIQKFDSKAPKILVKIIEKKDFLDNSPLSIYHKNFSNIAKKSLSNPKIPKVIINCATLDNQLNFQPIQSHPLFNVNLLTVNSDDLSYKDEILKISEEIENGLIAVSRDSSETECLRKILEITCTITTKYAFSSKEYLLSNLPEYSYNSLKNLANSKTASVGAKLHDLDLIYKEKSSSNYLACKPLVEKWKNTGMAFYQCLEDFDKVMENLNYKCTSDIRKCFEVMRNSIEVFEDQIFNLDEPLRRPGIKIRDELKQKTRDKIEDWSKLKPKDKYREYNRAFEQYTKEKINDVYIGYTKGKNGFASKRQEIYELFYRVLLKNTPVRFPDDGKLLKNILISYTAFKKITVESYSSHTISNSFHHVGVEDRAPWDKNLNDEETKLYQLNINFNLASHLELYIPLKDFLDFYIEQTEIISISFHRLVLEYYKQFVGLELEDNTQEEE